MSFHTKAIHIKRKQMILRTCFISWDEVARIDVNHVTYPMPEGFEIL